MTTVDDDRLLDELAAALRFEPSEPSPAEISAFRLLLAEQPAQPVTAISPRRWRRRRLVVAAAVAAALVVTGAAGAVATGTPLPNVLWGPGNNAAPADSPALSDAKAAMRELRDALDGPDDARVQRAHDTLAVQLTQLNASDRNQIDNEASDLLRRADERLASRSRPIGEGTGSGERPGSQSGEGHGAPGDDHTEHGGDTTSSGGATDRTGDSVGTGSVGSGSDSSGGDRSGDSGGTSRDGGDRASQIGAVNPDSGG